MTESLTDNALPRANGSATLPQYNRTTTTNGIVHLGVGAFHRAHQAVYVDDCLAAGELGWGIVGASLRSADTRDALQPQDCLYTVIVRSGDGEGLRVIGAIRELIVAPENPVHLLNWMTAPTTRIVTLTVTEKAYLRNATGELDASHPDIRWDIANPATPRTVFGFIAEALQRRRSEGARPFTVLSCDNLPANGATLRRLVLQYAQLRGGDLADHIDQNVRFPSSMVDRIVPATTDADRRLVEERLGLRDAWPISTEPFMQWVVEDSFSDGRPQWERFGVTMVEDVRPFEEMKLRLLNGAHSAIAYLGLLLGHATVADAFADARIRRFIDGLWREAIPTLPDGAGLQPNDYIAALAQRFSNPALKHRTAQIAMDGSQKLPQRILFSACDVLDAERTPEHLSFVIAAWIASCRERGLKLPAAHFTDPLDTHLAAIFSAWDKAPDLVRQIFPVAGFTAATGKCAEQLQAMATVHLKALLNSGPEAALSGLDG